MHVATNYSDSLAQSLFERQPMPKPSQLEMLFVYDSRTTWASPMAAQAVDAQQHRGVETDSPSASIDNWRVRELIDTGAWDNSERLEAARQALRHEVLECAWCDRQDVREALHLVAARIATLHSPSPIGHPFEAVELCH